jgi:hypothetical protein
MKEGFGQPFGKYTIKPGIRKLQTHPNPSLPKERGKILNSPSLRKRRGWGMSFELPDLVAE